MTKQNKEYFKTYKKLSKIRSFKIQNDIYFYLKKYSLKKYVDFNLETK